MTRPLKYIATIKSGWIIASNSSGDYVDYGWGHWYPIEQSLDGEIGEVLTDRNLGWASGPGQVRTVGISEDSILDWETPHRIRSYARGLFYSYVVGDDPYPPYSNETRYLQEYLGQDDWTRIPGDPILAPTASTSTSVSSSPCASPSGIPSASPSDYPDASSSASPSASPSPSDYSEYMGSDSYEGVPVCVEHFMEPIE
ncbi:MAG: hypothetical protein ACTSWQ_08865, partial [Candidatus Thorarchaeota archaeon]